MVDLLIFICGLIISLLDIFWVLFGTGDFWNFTYFCCHEPFYHNDTLCYKNMYFLSPSFCINTSHFAFFGSCWPHIFFSFYFQLCQLWFFFQKFLFILERGRECMRGRRGGGRGRDPGADSRLSTSPTKGRIPWPTRSRPELQPRADCVTTETPRRRPWPHFKPLFCE